MQALFEKAKYASKLVATLDDTLRNDILRDVAQAIVDNKERLLKANQQDLARMERTNPLYDRLQLTDSRLEAIAARIRLEVE